MSHLRSRYLILWLDILGREKERLEGRISGYLLHSEIQSVSLRDRGAMNRKTSIQLIKYIAVGGTAIRVEWTSFASLIGPARLHYLIAVTVSFITATAVNYVLSDRFILVRGRHPAYKELSCLTWSAQSDLF
jgi:hypothetical protein